ncbi:mechanosensitive ion channel family protein [Thiolapillus brandeum]|uniref:MscS mechanosensitive ion channel n=1 Tax=Thiolapillus brandeum TaxID=1076588 RepID=A0A7U6GIU3_9GAMM|nr:mechanosensitive ion channel family protein [Thiolapillus brandeum]BAO44411.1 MscS mechanosensitive ion channel [Thiolapillus brandeum]
MFVDILTKTYYGNTIGTYMLSFLLIIGTVVLARVVYWSIGHVIKKITRKTRNRLDDILVDMLEEPVVFAIAIIGIWFSLQLLHTSETTQTVISTAYYILIVFDVTWFLSRVMDALIKRYIVPLVQQSKSKLDDQLLPIIQKGLKIALWIMALLIALNNAGYNVGAVLASLGIGGIAFAMAAKDTIANLFGSFTIFVDKPFVVGDRVLLSGYDGFVREIGVRSTRLETLNGRIVTLPNSQVADECIENISSEPCRKITMDLGLTYDTSDEQMQQGMDILQDIIANNESTENKVVTAFTAFNDFSLNIRFIYYVRKGESVFGVQTRVNLEILRRFNEAGLEFAFPTQTIYTIPAAGS